MRPQTRSLLSFTAAYSGVWAIPQHFPAVIDGGATVWTAVLATAIFFLPAIGISRFFQLQTASKRWRNTLGLCMAVAIAFFGWMSVDIARGGADGYGVLRYLIGLPIGWGLSGLLAGIGGSRKHQHDITKFWGNATLLLLLISPIVIFGATIMSPLWSFALGSVPIAAIATVFSAAAAGPRDQFLQKLASSLESAPQPQTSA